MTGDRHRGPRTPICRLAIQTILAGLALLSGHAPVAAAGTPLSPPEPAPAGPPRHVLVLHSYHRGLSWTDQLDDGLRRALADQQPVELHTVYLDAKRHPLAQTEELLLALVASRFANRRPDVVVVSDNIALDLVRRHRGRLFPDTPVVFCGINDFQPRLIDPSGWYTGVVERTDPAATLALARHLRPDARRCVVIADDTPTGRAELAAARRALGAAVDGWQVRYWTGLGRDDLRSRLASLDPDRDVVLLTVFNRDAEGRYASYEESATWIAAASSAPVFGLWDFYLGTGVLGGRMASARDQGRIAGLMAGRILAGQPVRAVPIEHRSPNHVLLEADALRRFDVALADLPEGARVRQDGREIYRAAPGTVLRIGVLARNGADHCRAQWLPTVDALSRALQPVRCELVPLDFPEVAPAASAATVDLLLTNPLLFVQLDAEHRLSPLAMAAHRGPAQDVDRFGGVVFCRAEREDLDQLADLRGLSLAAPAEQSFGGWMAIQRELVDAGLDPRSDLAALDLVGTHVAVVTAVRTGAVDAGAIRTGQLEDLQAAGLVDPDEFRIVGRRAAAGFPHACSTRLYPEWPVAALPHVSDGLAQDVTVALLGMGRGGDADQAPGAMRWQVPHSYQPVRDCLADLGVPPYDQRGLLSRALARYWPWLLAGTFGFLGVALLAGRFAHLNAHLRAIGRRLRSSEKRHRAMFERNRSVQLLIDPQDGAIVDANPAACQFYGYGHAEIRALRIFQINTLPADQVQRGMQAVLADQRGALQFRHRLATGEIRDVEVRSCPLTVEGRKLLYSVVHDVTEQRRAEARFHDLLQRLRTITDTARDAILMAGPDGRITFWNPAAVELFGATYDQAMGAPIGRFVDRERFATALEAAGRARPRTRSLGSHGELVELTAYRRDGSRFLAEMSLTARELDEGRYAVGILRDVTDRKEHEEQLARSQEVLETMNLELEQSIARANALAMEAQIASMAKSEFLANMSHEIRTPMNGIIGMTGLLEGTALSEEQQQYAATVRTCGEQLLALINDILDFSKIEAGKLEFEELDFDLAQAVEEVVDIVGVKASEKQLQLLCYVAPEIPPVLRGDPGRLRQVIINFVNNAVKFTEAGEVEIRAELAAATAAEATLRFSVRDTGIGIPADRQDRLFQSFSQVDASTTRKYGGTGLGLAISRQLAELMGGEVGVQSAEGQGSTFWFTARLAIPSAEAAPPDLDALTDLSVLAVDGNATNRLILRRYLESWGTRCEVVASAAAAASALERARDQGSPHRVAILDRLLPDGDGLELAERLAAAGHTAETAMIMLTSAWRSGDAERLRRAGVHQSLLKPVRRALLAQALLGTLVPAGPERDAGATGSAGGETAAAGDPPLPSDLKILLAEDNVINQRVALLLLEKNLGLRADAVANGLEAVDALRHVDYDLVLMDCQMPELDGFAATRRIRSASSAVRDRTVPIIAMTANAMKGDRDVCLAAGMDDYVPKPVKADDLAAAIRRVLVGRDRSPGARTDSLPVPAG